ncbi:hypothetical protein GCM10027445_23800 [Amycolatopsis endophytica]|uniref:Alkanesulfonate monooxygenase SsuD/methylene tetrahydromethanopterin reductase-like flavin-dependent oxidoreductase (Luciferase family) n=1 Tax=Amycolatopsis endophytica TaxID=860233 RepID=A0A853BGI7_9PSEU|nr:LLM class flavin-dependent oxidoreductase [Amycolatopsis endophytica]NYI93646.1 alkanesulfonate monooxygenase SsuD/methylene tetrahydromethanopterin reductase-like flavin-dependent oxidoreductase (luciferase family) [Amycolatopsis endophytica]
MIEFGLLYDWRNPPRPQWFTPWQRFYREGFEHIAEMERRGVDIISFGEHHGDVDGFNPHIVESLVMAADRTSRVSLGTNIIQLPYYHPVMLAERLAFVDIMSGGRLKALGLGQIGSPWDVEMEMLGVNTKHRPSLLEEGLELLRRCWTEDEPFDYEGKRYQGKHITITPKPLQKPSPRMQVVGVSEASADRVARMGFDIGGPGGFFDGLTSKERWDAWLPMWQEVCARYDRDPDDVNISVFGQCFVTDDPERAAALHGDAVEYCLTWESRPSIHVYSDESLRHGGDKGLITGIDLRKTFMTPEEAIAEFRATHEKRAPDQFLLIATRPGMTWEQAAEYHGNFVDKVLPHLQDLPTRRPSEGASAQGPGGR